MIWTKVEQQEKYLEERDDYNQFKHGGVLYKDHLVILKNALERRENTLCCLNLRIHFLKSSSLLPFSKTQKIPGQLLTSKALVHPLVWTRIV